MTKTILLLLTCFINSLVVAEELIIIQDFAGNTLTSDQPATRIIALAPHIVENIYSAGAGQSLVGVVEYSNFPSEAEALPKVGNSLSINLETIISLQPDLIIAWGSGTSQQTLASLSELGFRIYVDEPTKLEDIAKSIRDIGTLAGTTSSAEKNANNFLDRLVETRMKHHQSSIVNVFYQVWNQPLQTINGQHIISSVIKLCGGHNIYADEAIIAPVINIESILDKDPDVIIASGTGLSRPIWLDDWNQWETLSATKNNHLFFVEADHIQRHTVRILLGAEKICSNLEKSRQHASLSTKEHS